MEYKSSAGYQPITNLLGLLGTQYNQEIMISWYNRILEALKKVLPRFHALSSSRSLEKLGRIG